MLKPKRKITRKEIKVDPMLESLASANEHFNTHKQTYVRGGAVIVIGILAVIFYMNRHSVAIHEANTALGKALISWETNDLDNAKFQFELLLDEYGHTVSGEQGAYYLGLIALKNGDTEMARTNLETFVNSNSVPILEASARMHLADLYASTGDIGSARKSLQQVGRLGCTSGQKDEANIRLFKLMISSGDTDEAEDLLNEFLAQENLHDKARNDAQQLLGMIQG